VAFDGGLRRRPPASNGRGNVMPEIILEIVEEQVSSLEEIGVEEGCSSSTTCSSLDISDVEFE
jgi:hypothetical protein